MGIDQEELKHLEDSLVHDDEAPHAEGWGIYLTQRFLAHVILTVSALTALGVELGRQAFEEGELMPVVLHRGSTAVALLMAVVAVVLHFTSDPEPELARQRTLKGKVITGVAAYVVLQLVILGLSIAVSKTFSL